MSARFALTRLLALEIGAMLQSSKGSIPMKKALLLSIATAASLALAGCGSSDDANEQASPDNVEMPAEDSMSTVAAQPVPDNGAPATFAADPNAAAVPDDAAAAAAEAAADFNAAGDPHAPMAEPPADKPM